MNNFIVDTEIDLSAYGRKVNAGWKIPLIKYNLEGVKELGLAEDVELPAYKNIPLDHPTVPLLKPYQKEAVYELVNTYSTGTLLYLSPGLGKGICSITANEILGHNNTLIVCSKTLITMWIEELKKWSKDGLDVDYDVWHEDYKPSQEWFYSKYCITSIEAFSGRFIYSDRNGARVATGIKRANVYDYHTFDCIIFDESLLLKNRNSARVKAFKATKANRIFLLSGSPVSRYYDDLWQQLNIIAPDAFTSYWKFANEYCRVNDLPGFAKAVAGNRPKMTIAENYTDLIFRRIKEQVLTDLPPLIFRDRNLELTALQRTLHDDIIDESCYTLESGEQVDIPFRIAKFTKLQQVVSSSNNLDGVAYESIKHDAIMDMLEARDVELPVIIWVHWLKGAKKLYNRLKDAYGKELKLGLGIGEDKTGIEPYKAGKVDILLLGMQVGKHGLTLTNTKSMIYVDRIADADAYNQSIARVERIGLKHSPTITILRAVDSYDNVIEDIIRNKNYGIATLANADLAKMLRGLSRRRNRHE